MRESRISSLAADSPPRVVIEHVSPEIDDGRFPIKRVVGESVVVGADIFADGHDAISAALLYRRRGEDTWLETPMIPEVNDRWHASFTVLEVGGFEYTLQAWIDPFASWRSGIFKKVEAGQDVSVDILVGANLVEKAATRAANVGPDQLQQFASVMRQENGHTPSEAISIATDENLARLMAKYPDRTLAATYAKTLMVEVDREKAGFSAWYEMFPRSCSTEPGRHGTFQDCINRLPYVAEMGFDVLYLPPIHPIGRKNRKGMNNNPGSSVMDVGSPWAIGAGEGGHKSIHPQLGTLEDFQRLIGEARGYELELAMDIAFQCTPDHPYVRQHPEWFRRRPDGTVQYAENPPKKYEDIYPLNFENPNWRELWEELKDVMVFWADLGVRIFRVDNPHTKPFEFWEWSIREIKKQYPDVIFLAEAFTRPKVMYRLAKLGFTQSYTYFAWRNSKWELEQYFTELTQSEAREYFRPNLWPNTPDILTDYLQSGGRPAFMIRLILAATLGANYGIYGPAFELCENRPLRAGSEEYFNSEKYEIRNWDLQRAESLKTLITRVNQIRRSNSALETNARLRFHSTDNAQLIAYSKTTEDLSNSMLIVVNLDPHYTQSGWLDLPLDYFELDPRHAFQVHDLLTDSRYLWHGTRNYVELNPHTMPAHILRLKPPVRSEPGFVDFM
ncbi:MAG TPA: alpha-1,4-glucan--maltose-1-phosphate maltosyltransferase [Terriglobia bacterium]|nr:alpha-1,4-glucan--maltose-1-phosphate maltosyltransferase [Terriglobia bacterium]